MNNVRRAIALSLAIIFGFAGQAWAKDESPSLARETCNHPLIEQPFTAFDDHRDYVLAPGGSFEDPSLPGWTLERGAGVAPGNDPFNVRGSQDSSSLALPAGASATSPAMCVDLNYPTMRFVGFQDDEKDAGLDVEVLYPDTPEGKPEWHKAKSFKAKRKDNWNVTKDVKISPERGGKIPGGRPLALRFTNDADHGTWRIDNLYVDPRRS